MRLLFLHLPEYGPLRKTALALPRVEVLANRAYALHFVVGVNGTGKSSVLRAIFRIFDCLGSGEWPNFNFEIAYEHRFPGAERPYTIVIWRRDSAKEEQGAVVLRGNERLTLASDEWKRWLNEWKRGEDSHQPWDSDGVVGGNFAHYLPSGVLAYTSGLIDPWKNLRHRPLERLDLDPLRDTEFDPTERSIIWSPREELEFSASRIPGSELVPELPTLKEWRAFLRKPSVADPRWRTRLLDPVDIRLAGLAVALKQAVHDLADLTDTSSQDAQRHKWARQKIEDAKSQGQVGHDLRWLLTAAGLAWPTHIAFTFDRNARDTWTGDTSERLLLLYALAENVAPLPLAQERVVISLHHRDSANIVAQLRLILGEEESEKLINGTKPKDTDPATESPAPKSGDTIVHSDGNTALADLLSAVGTPRYGAEALARVLGGRGANTLEAFRTLSFWRDQGLLIDATATFRRIERDTVVTYDQLSDGEQQLLQRGGLLLLLQGADDHLLLLDEPETHFNDRWKRELIDVIDDNLRSTQSHVILTTHSSIVLSDAFRDEILILTPDGVFHPSMPTFGADPSRILQHVFHSPDAIGQRAREALDKWLVEFGGRLAPERRLQLESILTEIGGGPERIRLREILANADAVKDS
jgi:ABC-type cobalamin/Fe3+-siderophores transport system ATPase subunit